MVNLYDKSPAPGRFEDFRRGVQSVNSMRMDRQPMWQYWRDLAQYILPSRYVWLSSPAEAQQQSRRNSSILDSTGTIAAKTLASGMMNGITSPARPWFKLRVPGLEVDDYPEIGVWTEDTERRIMRAMAESNFYQCMAILYQDLSVFASAGMLIYEGHDRPIHCYNPALGEFYLQQSSEHRVNGFARDFTFKVHQLVEEFGKDNCSLRVQNAYARGGASLFENIDVVHLVQPNTPRDDYRGVGPNFAFRECYWEKGESSGRYLRERGYFDLPGIFPRYELQGNDIYGTGPGMDALPDIIQLQHMTLKKAQALDKLVSPPILADVMLENRPMALLPNGVTFVPRLDATNGAKPIYTVNPPLGEMTQDIIQVQGRIRETFHNDLFQMISQLETVRSATEIDARREEKLVLLGPVLERFESEALDPAIKRIFGIMQRRGLLLPPPDLMRGAKLEIQYVSILSAAQSAVSTAPTERLLQVIGNVSPVFPEAKLIPNIPELLHDYALDIGVQQKNLRPLPEVEQTIAAQNQQAQAEQGLAQANSAAQSAQLLSQTDVGGGANALQRLLGSVT